MKAKNLAVDPGNASASKSNSGAQAKQVTRTPTAEEIQLRANEMYVERGGIHGFDTDDWLQAERELSARNTLRDGPKQATGEFSAEGTIPIACMNSNVQYAASRVRRGVESSSFVRSTPLL